MKQKYLGILNDAVKRMYAHPGREVLLFHHNDTDGLASGTILLTACERAGWTVKRYALEKPYPEVLDLVFREHTGKLIMFADFAGKIAPLIADKNRRQNLVFILDHHPAEPSPDDTVLNLDPDLFGLKGDLDISASTTCYLFAKAMHEGNRDLASLAVLGAVGDGFYVDGALVSENRQALMEALQQVLARVSTHDSGERYYIKISGKEYPCDFLSRHLDMLGAVGYYRNGADAGVRLCMYGLDEDITKLYEQCKAIKEERFSRQLEVLEEGGLVTGEYIQWFDTGNTFSPMGVKMVGVFCNELKDADFLDKTKYLAGFQHIPNEIPGFGKIRFDKTKISMRVSEHLAQEIRSGRMPGLSSFLPEATLRLGGFADACHSLSAATTIDIGMEDRLIEETERVFREITSRHKE